MEKSKRHIRHCLLFNYQLRKSAAEAISLKKPRYGSSAFVVVTITLKTTRGLADQQPLFKAN